MKQVEERKYCIVTCNVCLLCTGVRCEALLAHRTDGQLYPVTRLVQTSLHLILTLDKNESLSIVGQRLVSAAILTKDLCVLHYSRRYRESLDVTFLEGLQSCGLFGHQCFLVSETDIR